jgi:hypothetical protein
LLWRRYAQALSKLPADLYDIDLSLAENTMLSRGFWLTASLLLMCLGGSAAAQQVSDDMVAQQFMPSAIFVKYAAASPYLADDRERSGLRVDLDKSGNADYLAIAYTSVKIGYLRVVKLTPQPTLVGESGSTTYCDSPASVAVVDLDGDGRPELVMSCAVGNRSIQHASFFKWSGTGLVVLNPPHDTRKNAWAPITDPNFVDLYGDGKLEVLSPTGAWSGGEDSDEHPYDVFRLNGNHLVQAAVGVGYFNSFYRGTGKPYAEEVQFTVAPGVYVLTIVNGLRGANVVDSGVVTLNGSVVVTPSDFAKKKPVITLPVTLTAQNTLSVELRSAPESFIHVTVAPQPAP